VSCEAIRELFSARVDAALSADERARLDAHLASCPECAREWQRFEAAVELLRAAEPVRAPAGFVDRVLAARPRPWYRQLAATLLVPWPVKLPLEATAIVLVAGLAILVFQRSPELQQAARAPEATMDRLPAPSPSGAEPPPAERDPALPGAASRSVAPTPPVPAPAMSEQAPAPGVAPASPPPSPTPPKKEDSALRDEAKRPAPDETRPRAATSEEARKEAAHEAREALRPYARRDAESERAAGPRQTAPLPEPTSRVQTLAARPIDVEARLSVTERGTAERTVGELVARAGGHVVSRTDDAAATVLALAVPTERWDEMRRELERIGRLRIDRSAPRAGQLRVVLRLEP
jgi:Putative zinc-finger